MKESDKAGMPPVFLERMERLLGDGFLAFLESYETERAQGLRINRLKAGAREGCQWLPFHLRPVPWAEDGYYFGPEDRPGKHPWHEAGVYYIQEPSAMAAVTALSPRPGEKVLDLCSAPGGKGTQIAAQMGGRGFLLCNEFHPARAKILSQNIERMGIANCVVSNMDAKGLADRFCGFFDRVLVDAPCSGEGMFRKDGKAREEWGLGQVSRCAGRQLDILSHAAAMLRPGGRLVYSTCTFSPEEDEGVVQAFLESEPGFEVVGWEGGRLPGWSPGRPDWVEDGRPELSDTMRLWPHLAEGEGHFIAILHKAEGMGGVGSRRPAAKPSYVKDRSILAWYGGFCDRYLRDGASWRDTRYLILFGDQLYEVPEEMPDCAGLKLLRPGLHLGTVKKNRLEPSHALALHLKGRDACPCLDFPADGDAVAGYLRGEGIRMAEARDYGLTGQDGWVLVLADGFSLGWGKLAGGMVKNHYPKGLRRP